MKRWQDEEDDRPEGIPAPIVDPDGVPRCDNSGSCLMFWRECFREDGRDPSLVCEPAVRDMVACLRDATERISDLVNACNEAQELADQ